MDFKGYKKVSEDKHSAKMEHPKGHVIVIAKKGISPKELIILEKMPIHKAKGGMIKKAKYMADGGDSSDDSDDIYGAAPTGNQDDPSLPAPADAVSAGDGQGTVLAPAPVPTIDPDTGLPTSAPATAGATSADETPTYDYPDQSVSAAQTPAAQPEAPEAAPTAPAQNPVMANADAAAQQAQQAYQQAVQDGTRSDLMSESAKWGQDLDNGHITPETYASMFANKSTLGKVSTLFGILLSGAGSGLAHQQNAALGMMKDTLDRDYNAQVQSKSNAQNFYRLSQANQLNLANIDQLHKQGKLTDAQAAEATQNARIKAFAAGQMYNNQAALHHLVQSMKSMTPGTPQYITAQRQLVLLYQSVNNENYNLADRAAAATSMATATGTGLAGQLSLLRIGGQPELANQLEATALPGLQIRINSDGSKTLVRGNGDTYAQGNAAMSPAEKADIIDRTTFLDQAKALRDWSNANTGSLNPKAWATGQALARQLQNTYRQATGSGTWKAGDAAFINSMIKDDPTAFLSKYRSIPSLDAVINSSSHDTNNFLNSKGLPIYQIGTQAPGPQPTPGNSPEAASPSQPSEGDKGMSNGKPTIFYQGKWHYAK